MSRFLRQIHAVRYGGLVNREVGPFGPGLNVVYGPNEAGKSTVASLVGGVLFGWEGAHGVRNTYHPEKGGRSGRLTWGFVEDDAANRTGGDGAGSTSGGDADRADALERVPTESTGDDGMNQIAGTAGGDVASRIAGTAGGDVASRIAQAAGGDTRRAARLAGDASRAGSALSRDEDGIEGDLSVLGDIDRATYETIFSLTADELRTLRNSSDMTARLLTAGSGAASSPAAAFVEVERRIANTPVYALEAELEAAQERVKEATEQVKLYVQEGRELRELQASRTLTAKRTAELGSELDDLMRWRGELEAAETHAGQLEAELEELRTERESLIESGTASECRIDSRLLGLDSTGERVLRDRLDDLAEEAAKIERTVEVAKENSSTSSAAYEALCEIDDDELAASRRLRNRTSQAVVSVLLPIAFIMAGIPLFAHGRAINSLSFTTFGVALVVVAVFLAAAAFFVLFRPAPESGGIENRRKDAQWVMLQDRKKLDVRLAEQAEFNQRVTTFFEEAGLAAAEGSIRQARSLLDEAREVRSARAEDAQKAAALNMRIANTEKELTGIQATRERIGHELAEQGAQGMPGAVPGTAPFALGDAGEVARTLESAIREKTAQREALLGVSDDMSQRIGELSRDLEFAREDRTLDQVKFEYQQLRVRLREAKHELISLLLAKRMLERSIATWESQNQPEVNAQAGRLLATITDGRWVQVSTSPTGSLVAIGADGVARDPRHLSLGTCQQLYLALRIALLLTAEDVGRSVPVLADDILVNFDATRRRGAARALAELARVRQVIVFTCHEETAATLLSAAEDAVWVDL